ncbi:YkgJ family cysteine cluster protein [Acidobacteriota bacterium]
MNEKGCNPDQIIANIKGFELLKQAVLEGFPRLSAEDTFKFACHDGLECFNACCADVNIVLTPYDVLRMRKRLDMSSTEFCDKYTVTPFTKEMKFPLVILKLRDDEKKTCPFVSPSGCTIYEDRPWPCRMYPIGLASSNTDGTGEEFYFLLHEAPCDGFEKGKKWTIAEWMEDQGVGPYNEAGEGFKEITLHPRLLAGMELEPAKVEMYHMACYDQDRFRKFVFESSFLELYDIDDELKAGIKTDDLELLKFAYQWLKFCLFGDKVEMIRINPEVLAAKKAAMSEENGK